MGGEGGASRQTDGASSAGVIRPNISHLGLFVFKRLSERCTLSGYYHFALSCTRRRRPPPRGECSVTLNLGSFFAATAPAMRAREGRAASLS